MSKDHLMVPYSVLHGYVVPDSEDGFDGLDIVDPTGLVTCPFVKIPYDQELDDSHSLQDSVNHKKDKKRKEQEGDIGVKTVVEEEGGNVVKKIKEDEAGPVVKAEDNEEENQVEAVSANNEEDICLPNLIMGIFYPKFKSMPEYRAKWKSPRQEMKERMEMAEKKKKEEMTEIKKMEMEMAEKKIMGFCKKRADKE